MQTGQEKVLASWGLSAYDVVKTLYDLGHFFSAEALKVCLVEESDLPSLTLADEVVQAAVRSYQAYFAPDLDMLTQRAPQFGGLKRASIADGDVGENTILLLTMPRCGVPDFPHPTQGAQEANWPESCRGDITTSFKMTLPGISDAQLQAIWQAADAQWEKVIDVKFRLSQEEYPNTRIWAFAANLPGSTLADQYLAQNNCGARLQGRFDVRNWTPQLLQTTITHEHGHALGLNHLSDGSATMFPSIHQASLARWGAPNEADVRAALALGYKRREGPVPPPPPPGKKLVATLSQDGQRCVVDLVG